MSTVEQVREIVEPLLTDLDIELIDIEHSGPTLRITIDQPEGVGMEALTEATRTISRAMDTHDPLPGRYTLEVSSPGLERPLKRPEHFERAVGVLVKIKTKPEVEGDRRVEGTIASVDDDGITVALRDTVDQQRRLAFDDIAKARTVFEWGPTPKPGGPKSKKGTQNKQGAQNKQGNPKNSNRPKNSNKPKNSGTTSAKGAPGKPHTDSQKPSNSAKTNKSSRSNKTRPSPVAPDAGTGANANVAQNNSSSATTEGADKP
jgi:ribosome maturation factor RimP